MKQRGPRFDILAGSSLDELSRVKVNADRSGPLAIKTKSFEGNLTVRMKDFADYNGDIYRDTETNYFANWTDVTWSIQIQGRFLQPTSADDCVFGNTFDKPIRDRLPFGTGAALKAISYIDPSLENDLYADKPWAWSPLLATMNYIRTELASNSYLEILVHLPGSSFENSNHDFIEDALTPTIARCHHVRLLLGQSRIAAVC
ncbi:hypothetical protein PGTUg99_036451 [Puccinia graminis f. sp. tritici]|uniref:Domain of unknown function at the cortex 1 domain-containing protein n=1 Tax=Puccinia graminis f. sp. tritici TaxID=56615 RepID=A0A5B0RB81_PUCGR|nr:hypothetical protein PGTUg99_036451 [Puccinia graminis f. sp. tritici]